jgi:hypothetical protein
LALSNIEEIYVSELASVLYLGHKVLSVDPELGIGFGLGKYKNNKSANQ